MFSVFCLFNCVPSLIAGEWQGGSFMCDWQAAYISYAIFTSCWYNMPLCQYSLAPFNARQRSSS